MTDERRELSDRLAALEPPSDRPDWDDVERRARAHGYPGGRRRILALGMAAALVALAAVPAFGVGGDLIDLFRDPDKPALPRTVLNPYMRLEFDHMYGKWSLHKIASGRGVTFYAIRDGEGEVVCVGSGRATRREDPLGFLGCSRAGARRFRNRFVDYQVAAGASVRDPVLRPVRLTGVAAEKVAKIELRGGGEVVEVPIEDHVFTTTSFPGEDEIRIAALDDDGKVVFTEYLQGFSPRDRGPRAQLPPPVVRRGPSRPRPVRLLPLPTRDPVQRGSAGGATVTIYPPNFAAFRIQPGSAPDRLLAGKGVSPSCFKFVRVDGRWYPFGTGGPSRLYRRELRQRLSHVPFEAPYDGCSVQGEYGRRWNDPRGMHAPLEVPLTERGRRYFAERAAARDLAYFVRSPRIKVLRRALKRDPQAVLPIATEVARRFPERVVALKSATELPSSGEIGVWTDGNRTLVATRSVGGRRLFVDLRSGRIGRHNLRHLAFVF